MVDLTYSKDAMFTRFLPNTEQGETAWREMAKHNAGTGAVLNAHAESTIKQLKAAGYTVARRRGKGNCMNDLVEVLVWVNETRNTLGLAPLDTLPLGKQRQPSKCVIAQALTVPGYITQCGLFSVKIYTPSVQEVLLPKMITHFIEDFDTDLYPQLIEKDTV